MPPIDCSPNKHTDIIVIGFKTVADNEGNTTVSGLPNLGYTPPAGRYLVEIDNVSLSSSATVLNGVVFISVLFASDLPSAQNMVYNSFSGHGIPDESTLTGNFTSSQVVRMATRLGGLAGEGCTAAYSTGFRAAQNAILSSNRAKFTINNLPGGRTPYLHIATRGVPATVFVGATIYITQL